MPFEYVAQGIAARKQQSLLRQPVTVNAVSGARLQIQDRWYHNFSGNDYLGMSQHPEVLKAFNGVLPAGSGASPLVTGFTQQHQALCDYLCELTGQEAAMLFSSGFAANYAVCHTLMSNNEGLILADKLSHASLIDGSVSAAAQFRRFKHNDTLHLRALLSASMAKHQDILVVSEGVFSMDGDQAPVAELLQVSGEANAWLMLDNAHSIGILGKQQFGAQFDSQWRIPEIVMATFGKAVGTGGAFVAGSQTLIMYLQNFARHYVYSTAFSAAHAHATLISLKLLEKEPSFRQQLQQNIAFFRQQCAKYGIALSGSETAIQPVHVGTPEATLQLSQMLREQGFWVTGIRYPTVPKNTDRLRITLSTLHSEADIAALATHLASALDRVRGGVQ